MISKENNFAFIDSNNLNLGIKEIGWAHYLYDKNKLKRVLSPNYEKCSVLLKKAARELIDFLDYQKNKLVRK